MPVAQLVHLFETIEHSTTESGLGKMVRSSKKASFSSGRRLSLRTIFKSHARVSSFSSVASATSPTSSTSSVNFLPMSSTHTSPQSERSSDAFAFFAPMCDFPEPKAPKLVRPVRIQRTFSSTSVALESEYRMDQLRGSGLDLFEPRPHAISRGSQSSMESLIFDGIIQVMESG